MRIKRILIGSFDLMADVVILIAAGYGTYFAHRHYQPHFLPWWIIAASSAAGFMLVAHSCYVRFRQHRLTTIQRSIFKNLRSLSFDVLYLDRRQGSVVGIDFYDGSYAVRSLTLSELEAIDRTPKESAALLWKVYLVNGREPTIRLAYEVVRSTFNAEDARNLDAPRFDKSSHLARAARRGQLKVGLTEARTLMESIGRLRATTFSV